MIDMHIPTTSLGVFNFSQYVRRHGKETFSYIFFDNFEAISSWYLNGRMRDVTYDHIQKTILCRSIHLGYDFFQCPSCGDESIVAHTCKSRFCSSCGANSSQQRAAFVSTMALESKHRHIVFTIPQQLRMFFLRDRSLLDGFFIASRNTLSSLFNDSKFRKNKRKNTLKSKKSLRSKYLYKDTSGTIVYGAIASLHTFGRDLDWNPHLHVLVCQDAFDSNHHKIKNFSYMSYEKLRQTWRYQILDYLTQRIGDNEEFQRLKLWFYTKYLKGFYVHAPEPKKEQDQEDIDQCVRYITRYTSRPVMAESRIVTYDDIHKQIHWFYHRHDDDKRIDVKEPVENFIQKVIRHCPQEHFKMVRYYGLYSNKGANSYNLMARLLSDKQQRVIKTKTQRQAILNIKKAKTHYRYSMIQLFQRDPLLCKCGEIMVYVESYIPLKGEKRNDRQYRDRCIYENKYLKKGRRRLVYR